MPIYKTSYRLILGVVCSLIPSRGFAYPDPYEDPVVYRSELSGQRTIFVMRDVSVTDPKVASGVFAGTTTRPIRDIRLTILMGDAHHTKPRFLGSFEGQSVRNAEGFTNEPRILVVVCFRDFTLVLTQLGPGNYAKLFGIQPNAKEPKELTPSYSPVSIAGWDRSSVDFDIVGSPEENNLTLTVKATKLEPLRKFHLRPDRGQFRWVEDASDARPLDTK